VIERARAEARSLASETISSAQSSFQRQGYELQRCGLLLSSGKPLPELSKILTSHALIHTADGELFREAILHASARSGIETYTALESGLLGRASQMLELRDVELARCLVDAGAEVGSPWTQDEKMATLVAWLSLIGQRRAPRKCEEN
jgi:hypothetical protein